MDLTKRALGYLKRRYTVVLKKNFMLNTFGALAIAGALVVGGAGMAGAAAPVEIDATWSQATDNTTDAVLNADTVTPTGNIVVHHLNLNGKTLDLNNFEVDVDQNGIKDAGRLSFGAGTNIVDGNLSFGGDAANDTLSFDYFDSTSLAGDSKLLVTGDMTITKRNLDEDLGRHDFYVGNINHNNPNVGINIDQDLSFSTDEPDHARHIGMKSLTIKGSPNADDGNTDVTFTGKSADNATVHAKVTGAITITGDNGGADHGNDAKLTFGESSLLTGTSVTLTGGSGHASAAFNGGNTEFQVENSASANIQSLTLRGGAGGADAAADGGDAIAEIGSATFTHSPSVLGAVVLQGGTGGAAGAGGKAELKIIGDVIISALNMTGGTGANDGNAFVNIVGGANDITLNLDNDLTISANNFVQTATQTGQIGIADANSEFEVNNLTLDGGGAAQTINLAAANTGLDADTIVVRGGAAGNETDLAIDKGTVEIFGGGVGVDALTAGTVVLGSDASLIFGDDNAPQRSGNINATINAQGKMEIEGGTWVAKKAINLGAAGTLNIGAGSFDTSNTTLIAAANKITTTAGSTLVVNNNNAGLDAATGAFTAADLGATQDNINGAVIINGLDATTAATLSYADYRNNYVTEAQKIFANSSGLTLTGIQFDTTGITLDQANGDTSLGAYAVAIGTAPVNANTVVGSITGTGDVIVDGGTLGITGNNAVSGVLFDGNIALANAGDDLTLGTGTVTGKVDGAGNLIATGAAKVDGADGVSVAALNVVLGASLETTKVVATADANIDGKANVTGADGVDVSSVQIGQGGSLTAKKVTADGGQSNILGTAKVEGDFVATGQLVRVGDDDKAGSLSAGTFTGQLIADPDWDQSASVVAFDTVNAADLAAARNSTIAVGTTDTMWVQSQMQKASLKLSENGITAAFGIATNPLDLSVAAPGVNSGIVVDGSTNTPVFAAKGDANFTAGSLLVVDAAAGSGTKVALTAVNIDVDDNSKLLISNAGGVDKVTVATATTALNIDDTKGWSDDADNLHFDSVFFKGELDATTTANTAVVNITQRNATEIMPKLDGGLGGLIDTGIVNNIQSPGMTFVRNATNNQAPNEAEATIEGGAQLGNVVGVASYTMGAAKAASGALTVRNTVSGAGNQVQETAALTLNEEGVSAGSGMKNGIGVWLMPLYKWSSITGAEAGNFDSDVNVGLGGVALGTDYTFNDMFRVGLALNIGAGYSESNGDFNSATSNFDFWGISAYGAYMRNNFTALLDFGYTGMYSDVDQNTAIGNLETDISSNVWTIGLTAEYVWETSALDITPHAGVRYISVTTNDYDVSGNAGRVFEVESNTQNVWNFPVGVTLSKDIEMESGWNFTPKLDVGFIASAGDLESTAKTSITGVAGSTDLTMQNVDGFAFNGGLGFDISNENMTLGINYNLLASEHETDHMIFATFRYDF